MSELVEGAALEKRCPDHIGTEGSNPSLSAKFKNMIEPFFNYIKNLGYTNDNLNKVKILLEKVSKITKYTKEEILEKCDYIIVDTKKEKLESILAELRSVIFLNTISFKNIEILKRHKKKKNVDILASLSNDKFDIEVTCFTKEH